MPCTRRQFTALACAVPLGAAGDPLKGIRSGHPRLILGADTIPRIKRLVANSAICARAYKEIRGNADAILGQEPSRREIPDGLRLLATSRRVKERVHSLALVYLMERDRRYRNRMWAELEAASQFEDWNPRHFLDVAEMTYAFAIAYDWLYADWTAEQRKTLREAIIKHGLNAGMKVYGTNSGWHTRDNNWNQVCNGGLGIGALAVADEHPALARDILVNAVKSLPLAMSHYAPDGAGTEGATYWDYGSRFNIKFLHTLDTALGHDFGLSKIPGFAESGLYQMYMSGARGVAFDFEDCGLRRLSTPMHFWMARKFGRPEYSWFRYRALESGEDTGNILDLLWFDEAGRNYDTAKLPLDRHFRSAEAVTVRGSWTDPNTAIVSMQAGDNSNLKGHRHLDLGTFMLDAQGERWFMDSGVDHETYQTHNNHIKRQDFYRIRAEGHNTLVIDPDQGPDQDPEAKARVVSYSSKPDAVTAVFDLTPAYAKRARKVERTLTVERPSRVIITDRVATSKPAEIWWFGHTEAQVNLSADGRGAVLSRNGKSYKVSLLAPAQARFQVTDASPLPTSPNPKGQADNSGRRKLAVHVSGVTETEIKVVFGAD